MALAPQSELVRFLSLQDDVDCPMKCCSVGNSMVGRTVADLFRAEDRGLAMNLFTLMTFLGQVSFA